MEAERRLAERRRSAPDVAARLAEAVAAGCGEMDPTHPGLKAAAAIAGEVNRFGAAFPEGEEPRYHDRHHQGEATLVMGWLCGLARRAGLLDREAAMLGIASMAAHDLHHPGIPGRAPRALEEASASLAVRLAAAEGASAGWCEGLRGVILATAMPQPPDTERLPLLHRLAHEADVFASTLPSLGWTLSRLMSEEVRRAGDPRAAVPATHAGRLAFLVAVPPATEPAAALGLAAARAWQIEAYVRCAERLGAGETAADGAVALDGLAAAEAAALLEAALAQAGVPR